MRKHISSGSPFESQIGFSRKAAEASLEEWYFSKKTYKCSKDPIYYSKIKF